MNERIAGILAWGNLVLITACTAAVVLLSVGTRSGDATVFTDPLNGWITALVGALIVSKRSRNPIGWVLLLISLSLSVSTFTESYAIQAVPRGLDAVPGAVLSVWASQLLWVGIFIGLTLLLHLFPTGNPLDRFWGAVMWVSVAVETGMMILFAVQTPMTVETPDGVTIEVPNPFGLVTIREEAVFVALFIGVLILPIVLALTAMFLRYVRARGVERQQMKWLLYAAAVFVAAMVISFGLTNPITDALIEVAAFGMPIAVGIALFRYRLYDIDLIIRRTLTYGVLTALLLGVFASSIIVLQQVFASFTGTGQNELVTVLSTLAIAALFVPLRNKLQAWIDRRFNRKKYDAQQVLQDFAQTVRDETDLEKLTGRLMQVVQETMEPKSLSLWLKDPREGHVRE